MMGVQPFQLMATWWQAATASHGIPLRTFSEQIGLAGKVHKEWEWIVSEKIPGYKYFLCTNLVVQPFTPTVPGHPGLIIHPPKVLLQFKDSGIPFHVLSAVGSGQTLQYQGVYWDSPYSRVEFDRNQMDYHVMPLF